MVIEEYLSLDIDDQLKWLNKQRATKKLKIIEAELGAKAYVIEKPIKHAGYKYDNNLKRYVLQQVNRVPQDSDALEYIEQHFATIKSLVQQLDGSEYSKVMMIDKLILNNRVYKSKGLKVQEDVYMRFVELYKQQYQQYKLQDIISQALLEFCQRYKENEIVDREKECSVLNDEFE